MLSRTAANLFWMGRYLERAESTARMLEACLQPGLSEKDVSELPLRTTGTLTDFYKKNPDLNSENLSEKISQFLCWDEEQLNSIWNCMRQARENARSVRSRLTSEMWEAINQTWLDLAEWKKRPHHSSEFYEWIRNRAYLFQGATQGTMPRSMARSFLRLGTFLERSEQTLRILESHDHLRSSGSYSDFYHWSLLLRMVSALEAYQETHGEVPEGHRVVQLLLFHRALPRSVRYCMERTMGLLEEIQTVKSRPLRKESAQLLALMQYDSIEDIQSIGMDEYLHKRIYDMTHIGKLIHDFYFEATC